MVIKKALFMIPGENYRNKLKILKKAPTAYSLRPQVPGGKHHDLKVGLAQILMHMVQRRQSPSLGRSRAVSTWLHCSPGPAAMSQSCRLAAALSLVGRGCAQGKDAQRVGSRIDLRLALEPSQNTLSGKIVGGKIMIFTALGGAQSLGFTA